MIFSVFPKLCFKRTPHQTTTSLFPTFPFFAGTDLKDVVVEGYLCTFQMTLVQARPKDDTTWSPRMECTCITLELHSDPKHILFLHIDHRINPLLCFSTVCVICWLQRKRRPPSSLHPPWRYERKTPVLVNVWPTQHGRSKTLQSLTRFRRDSMR